MAKAKAKTATKTKTASRSGISAATVEAAFGVTLPPRYRDFLDGGEWRKHNGRFVADMPGLPDPRQVVFDAPKLLTAWRTHGVKVGKILPLAALKNNPELLTVDIGDPACPVGVWDEGSFHKFLPSLDALLAALLDKGQKSPRERLEAAVEEAKALRKLDKEPQAVAVLDAAIGDLTPSTVLPGARRELSAALAARASALLYLGQTARAFADYDASFAIGSKAGNYAMLNLCAYYLKQRDAAKLAATAQRLADGEYAKDEYTWFWCQLYAALAKLLSDDEKGARAVLAAMAKEFKGERELRAKGREKLEAFGASAKLIALLN